MLVCRTDSIRNMTAGTIPFSSNCWSFRTAALIARSPRPNPQYRFVASHRIPPGESTPLVEEHRSDPQPKPTQNTVNETCEEIFLKILATIKVRSLDYWGHIHVGRCFLLGDDPVTGNNYDHRKIWIEEQLQRLSACFGIDLLCFAILSNHFHLILRSRPDVVAMWDDTEVARRWLMLCPVRKNDEGFAEEPIEAELNMIRNNPQMDWTSRQLADGKPGSTPQDAPPIFERLSIDADVWCKLVGGFGRLFWNVAGRPQTIDATRSRIGQHRYHIPKQTRNVLSMGIRRRQFL